MAKENVPQVEIVGSIKNSFKDKVKNIKSDFNNLLNTRDLKSGSNLLNQDQ